MRILLASIFSLLPLTAQAEPFVHTSSGAADSDSTAASADEVDSYCNSSSLTDELRLCGNPYSPASPTNFEALIGPYLYVQGQRGLILYDPRFPSVNDREFHSVFHDRPVAGWTDRGDSQGMYKPF